MTVQGTQKNEQVLSVMRSREKQTHKRGNTMNHFDCVRVFETHKNQCMQCPFRLLCTNRLKSRADRLVALGCVFTEEMNAYTKVLANAEKTRNYNDVISRKTAFSTTELILQELRRRKPTEKQYGEALNFLSVLTPLLKSFGVQ